MTRFSKYPNNNLRGVQPSGPQNVSQNIGSNRVFWCDRDPTTNDFDNWFIGSRWISYAAGATASPKIWTLVRKTIGAGHTKTSTWIESGEVDQSNIVYVGKHGNDANDGKTIDKAKLTFVAAISASSSFDTIWCFDNGVYTENLTGKNFVNIFAPRAHLVGSHKMSGTGEIWQFRQFTVNTGTTGFTTPLLAGASYIKAAHFICDGTGIGIEYISGASFCYVDIDFIRIENGSFIGPNTTGKIFTWFNQISNIGTGTVFQGTFSGGWTANIRSIGNDITCVSGGTVFGTTGAGAPIISLTASYVNADILSNITAGSIVTTNIVYKTGALAEVGAGTVDPGKLEWNVITADLNPVVKNHGYICNKAGLLTLTLPTTAAVGEIFRVTGINIALGWTVAQNAGQQIHIDNLSTTPGIGGSISSSAIRDSVELVCVVANTEWNATSFVGTITVV